MMFKLFSSPPDGQDRSGAEARGGGNSRGLCQKAVGVIALLLLGACRTAPPLPAVDLEKPGWEIHQGQALWTPRRDAPEIAGEILVATGPGERILVQFNKNPFPMVTAGVGPASWEMTIPTQGKRYSYPGKPPRRVLWFQLPTAIAGKSLTRPWVWTAPDPGGRWRLANTATGEALEGCFWP